jgi:hypothetical protein
MNVRPARFAGERPSAGPHGAAHGASLERGPPPRNAGLLAGPRRGQGPRGKLYGRVEKRTTLAAIRTALSWV